MKPLWSAGFLSATSTGDSLGKSAAGLEEQEIFSPTGKTKWNRKALNKLLSNEKYMSCVSTFLD